MSDPLSKVASALTSSGVIPTVVPTSFTPSMLFSVVWPGTGAEVILGEQIVRDLTLDEPEIKVLPMGGTGSSGASGAWAQDDGDTPPPTYTLVMTDPDAPSRADPKYGEWRHWVVPGVELPASNTAQNDSFALKPKAATTPYYPPGPPPGTGLHRYIFLLFQEPKGGISIPADAPEHQSEFTSRRSWNAMAFAEKFNLKLVGVNYFLTQAMESSSE
ncbi:hypothetical protein D9619_009388 [Psilocybe cf. subviscida]|uniref:Phosphatidylethanolamine-binding protein n=1 Tax=Psilocybe cf. subviscida TaxID=2480587 RepID=A0A8H5BW34_9AGAR|nr:hypothetical protein D9619_009388 [Psilocybe cf. subviscida]